MFKPLNFYIWIKNNITYSCIYKIIIVLVSLIVLSIIWAYSKNYYENLSKEKFNNSVLENIDHIKKRMAQYENVLRSGLGFFYAKEEVSQEEWSNFVKILDIKNQYPGIKSIGYCKIIKSDEIPQIQEKMHKNGLSDFSIHPKGKRKEYSPILYVEPIGKHNYKTIGYDMYFEDTRKQTMQYARDTGLTSITTRVKLLQDINSNIENGMIMYIPLYKKDSNTDTVKERQEAIKGFIFSPFHMKNLMNKLTLEISSINFEIYDSKDMSENHLLHRSFNPSSHVSKYQVTKKLKINNCTWHIKFASTPSFDAQANTKPHLWITLIGLIFNLFLIIILLALIRSKQQIQAQSKKNEEQSSFMLYQSRLAQMGEMLSMIAHQWRQPLASISAITGSLNIEITMDKYEKKSFLERLNSIEELSQHLSYTINDFKDFFKDSKKQQLVNIKELVDETLKIIGSSLSSKDIEVNFEYKNEISIYTFFNEVKHVLLNILKNAEDALEEKKHKDAKIWISWYLKEDSVCLAVEDNAGGVSKDIIKTIFDPYVSTKQTKDGTGLGLYMSKRIIEDNCQGTLSLVNTVRGAKFIIELPVRTPTN